MFHYPWTLYLCTLTIWSFQIQHKRPKAPLPLPLPHAHPTTHTDENANAKDTADEEGDWDSRAEMNALVSALARSNTDELERVAARYRSRDLPRVMARVLGAVRWAVVQEGVIVLRGLGVK